MIYGLFSLTLFVSAALIFWVQLFASKMLLPILGGGAAVWNTCLVFFQLALLAGYLYAHLTSRWRLGVSLVVQPVLLAAGAAVLPLALAASIPPAPGADPVSWLLRTLLLTVGPPFVVLAATAPLLQRWFAASGHKAASDPYFLYAASNLGSLLVLVAYLLAIEPHLTLDEQSRSWTASYIGLVALTALCAVAVFLRRRRGDLTVAATAPIDAASGAAIGWAQRGWWLLLAFVPSSLLLGVTSHLTTDVAAAPLFWVVPLILYLLTFVLAFQRLFPLPSGIVQNAQAILLVALALSLVTDQSGEPVPLFALHLAAFFATALVCHAEAVRRRPGAGQLTEFYLLIAAGGALGGIFNAIVAPLVFDRIVEYPLVLAIAAFLRSGALPARGRLMPAIVDLAFPTLLFALLVWLQRDTPLDLTDLDSTATFVIVLLVALMVFAGRSRPLRFGLAVAALIGAAAVIGENDEVLAHVRNFYGTVRVIAQDSPPMHVLLHGTTTHGAQDLDARDRLKPLSYYHRNGPLGQLFKAVGGTRLTRNVAVVGLGAGTIACYAHTGEAWTYFEINPAVVAIARDRAFFTFIEDCPAKPQIVLGDARLSLAQRPAGSYDMIILDAFTSDAIPVHLMTREAVALYLAKLRPGGLLVFHISNRFLNLAPVLGTIAGSLDLVARRWSDDEESEGDGEASQKDASEWVVLAAKNADLAPIASDKRWSGLPQVAGQGAWTDSYSNLLQVLAR